MSWFSAQDGKTMAVVPNIMNCSELPIMDVTMQFL